MKAYLLCCRHQYFEPRYQRLIFTNKSDALKKAAAYMVSAIKAKDLPRTEEQASVYDNYGVHCHCTCGQWGCYATNSSIKDNNERLAGLRSVMTLIGQEKIEEAIEPFNRYSLGSVEVTKHELV